jgi:ABC-2 type transport system permease protein
MGAVIKKELKNYFLSPIGYVVIGIFLIIFSTFFFVTTITTPSVDLANLFYCVAFYGLMFIAPLLTMWTFAGERKSGTEQILLTAPVSMLGVVIAKFLVSLILVVIPLICTLMYFGILCFFEVPNIPIYLTSMLGFLLLSMCYMSFGILVSSLTESPIISGILTFAFVSATTWMPEFVSSLESFSLINKFITFLYGQIDITAIILFVTFTILCILITMIIMQRRKSIK